MEARLQLSLLFCQLVCIFAATCLWNAGEVDPKPAWSQVFLAPAKGYSKALRISAASRNLLEVFSWYAAGKSQPDQGDRVACLCSSDPESPFISSQTESLSHGPGSSCSFGWRVASAAGIGADDFPDPGGPLPTTRATRKSRSHARTLATFQLQAAAGEVAVRLAPRRRLRGSPTWGSTGHALHSSLHPRRVAASSHPGRGHGSRRNLAWIMGILWQACCRNGFATDGERTDHTRDSCMPELILVKASTLRGIVQWHQCQWASRLRQA